jgi:CRISPR-associated protein Csd2
MSLTKKIDFAVIIGVKHANPNGDPLNGNRPRITYDGFGEISDVCIKRKLRNRLLDAGENILVQSDDYRQDDCRSITDRCIKELGVLLSSNDTDKKFAKACEVWFDVRAFGQVFAISNKANKGKKPKNAKKDDENSNNGNDGGDGKADVSFAVRGPVSIQSAFSVEPIDVSSLQITKSVNLKTDTDDPSRKAPDTMGMKHRVDSGVYVTFGSINGQLAEKTGFSDDDAEKLKNAMLRLFENDESSARPAGSMEVLKVIWWMHKDKILSSASVHRSLHVNADGTYTRDPLEGIDVQELSGL